jgi:hypothetical protein
MDEGRNRVNSDVDDTISKLAQMTFEHPKSLYIRDMARRLCTEVVDPLFERLSKSQVDPYESPPDTWVCMCI